MQQLVCFLGGRGHSLSSSFPLLLAGGPSDSRASGFLESRSGIPVQKMKETQVKKDQIPQDPGTVLTILCYLQDSMIKNLNFYHVLATYLDLFTAENNPVLDEEALQLEKHSHLLLDSSLLPFTQLNVPIKVPRWKGKFKEYKVLIWYIYIYIYCKTITSSSISRARKRQWFRKTFLLYRPKFILQWAMAGRRARRI